jgi:glycosyltransferase involved in cell wall biosynthesis
MKLGIVASEFPPQPGGMQQHALGVAEELSKYYEVIVLTNSQHREHLYENAFEVRPVLTNRWCPDFDEIAAVSADAVLTLNAGYAPLSNFTNKPVFCYCHGNDFLNPWIDSTPESFRKFAKKLEKKLRKIVNIESYRLYIQRNICRHNIANGLKDAKLIFVNSYYTKNVLSNNFQNCKTPIYVAHPGIPDYMFNSSQIVQPMPRKDGAIRLTTIARLSINARKKNVDNVLRALSKMKSDIDFEYRIIGDGNMRLELESLAAELGVSEQTRFLGTRPNSEIPAWLDESDLFMLPSKASKRDVESFGIVYAEAAARGVPSLMSRMGGATDAVKDGVSGIIIEGAEPHDIAEGIRRYQREREKFSPEAIRAFAEEFRWSRIGERLREQIDMQMFGDKASSGPGDV